MSPPPAPSQRAGPPVVDIQLTAESLADLASGELAASVTHGALPAPQTLRREAAGSASAPTQCRWTATQPSEDE
jgi:hypothetical protein